MHAAQCRDGWFSVDTAEWIADRGGVRRGADRRSARVAGGQRLPLPAHRRSAVVGQGRTGADTTGMYGDGECWDLTPAPSTTSCPSALHKRHMVERCRLSLPTWASAHVPSSRANGLRARRPRARPRQSARYTRMSADGEFRVPLDFGPLSTAITRAARSRPWPPCRTRSRPLSRTGRADPEPLR